MSPVQNIIYLDCFSVWTSIIYNFIFIKTPLYFSKSMDYYNHFEIIHLFFSFYYILFKGTDFIFYLPTNLSKNYTYLRYTIWWCEIYISNT